LASVEKAAPFPAMPDELNQDIEISVPFKFSVR
jgi:outer membrane biosynthesis protein TonB